MGRIYSERGRAVKAAADTSVEMYRRDSPSALSSESNLSGEYYKQRVSKVAAIRTVPL